MLVCRVDPTRMSVCVCFQLLKLISTWDIIATEAALVELGINQLLNAKLLIVLQCLVKTAPMLSMAAATANVLCLVRLPCSCCVVALFCPWHSCVFGVNADLRIGAHAAS